MKYSIIYADPPWSYHNYENNTASRWVGNQYPVMNDKDIAALPVVDMAAKNCALFIWITMPRLPDVFPIIEAWGFSYKTCAFTWIKRNKKAPTLFWGMGYYTRSNAELCLLATRGKVLKRVSHSVHSVVNAPVEGHSKKPDIVKEKIIELFGDLPRIELFARQKTEGWDVWGNELESDIGL